MWVDSSDEEDDEDVQLLLQVTGARKRRRPAAEEGERRRRRREAEAGLLCGQARAAYLAGETSEAWALCEDALRLQGDCWEAYELLTVLAQDRGQPLEVVAELAYAGAQFALSVGPCLMAARHARLLGRSDRVRECLDKAVLLDPADTDARWARVEMWEQLLSQPQSALSDLVALWKLAPNDFRVANRLARIYLEIGLYDKGVDILSCVTHDPVLYVELLIRVGRFDEAITSATSSSLQSPELTSLKGCALAYKGCLLEAEECWRSILAPTCLSQSYIALYWLEQGQLNQAVQMGPLLDLPSGERRARFVDYVNLQLQVCNGQEEAALSTLSRFLDDNVFLVGLPGAAQKVEAAGVPGAKEVMTRLEALGRLRVAEAGGKVDDLMEEEEEEEKELDSLVVAEVGSVARGWMHRLPDDLPPCPAAILELAPRELLEQMEAAFGRRQPLAALQMSAEMLALDVSRRLSSESSGTNKAVPSDVTSSSSLFRGSRSLNLLTELGESRYRKFMTVVIRSLVLVGNLEDCSRYIAEIWRVNLRKGHQWLMKLTYAIGWPFSNSDAIDVLVPLLRRRLKRGKAKKLLWNFLSRATSWSPEKFVQNSDKIIEMFEREPDVLQHALFRGHVEMHKGRFQEAVSYYLKATSIAGGLDSTISLCLCAAYLNLANMGDSSMRIRAMQILLRYNQQEAFSSNAAYNLGRVYHELRMFTEAERFYLLACREFDPSSDVTCLARDAAYNLHLLYKEIGKPHQAMQMLTQYMMF